MRVTSFLVGFVASLAISSGAQACAPDEIAKLATKPTRKEVTRIFFSYVHNLSNDPYRPIDSGLAIDCDSQVTAMLQFYDKGGFFENI